jgi:hypothetical protein
VSVDRKLIKIPTPESEDEVVLVNPIAQERISVALARASATASAAKQTIGDVAAQCGIDLAIPDNGWTYNEDLGAFTHPGPGVAEVPAPREPPGAAESS